MSWIRKIAENPTGKHLFSKASSDRVKNLLKITLALLLTFAGIEVVSSYFLYRYYSAFAETIAPEGFASVELARRGIDKLKGKRRGIEMTVDPFPLFFTDPVLGYSVHSGQYDITERFNNRSHRFHLEIDDHFDRVTSYVRNSSPRRIIMAADSALFGWGLDDEFTAPWLLQTRLQNFHVVNESLTSYSTIQALMRLERTEPKVNDQDIIVLDYHPVTDEYNVAATVTLRDIKFELKLGAHDMPRMLVPFGVIDAHGDLSIHRVPLECLNDKAASVECGRDARPETATRITELAIDRVIALHAGHVVLLCTSAEDSNPVIAYARAKGVIIADGRPAADAPDADDAIETDSHAGPFWHYNVYRRLLETLQREHLVD